MSVTRKANDGHILRGYAELPARPWFLAPPLRIGPKPGAEMLTLYTIQSRSAYEVLTRDGVLVGDPSRGEENFREAYDWMHRQMARLRPGPGDGLLWLWVAPTRERLRDTARHARGDVILTINVPPDRVLLSEYGDWHTILNRSLHVPQRPGESDEEWELRWRTPADAFDARREPYESLPIDEWPSNLRMEIEASWAAIFDPTTWDPTPDLQATIRELRREDVVRAVRIR